LFVFFECLSGAEVDGLIVDALQAFGQTLKVPSPFLVSIVYRMSDFNSWFGPMESNYFPFLLIIV